MPKRIIRRSTAQDDDRPVPVEEEEQETPAPRRGRVPRASKTYDEAPVRDDDEDDEKPTKGSDPVRGGWQGYQKTKELGGDFPDEFKPTEDQQLIKFLEDEPFANYRQHWVERPGKKSWTCLADKCPLCDIGDRPALKACFNIVVFNEDGEPENKVWIVGTRIATQLQNFATDSKTGPLTRLYWAVNKAGKKGAQTTSIIPVKERDLKDDWDVEPLNDEELKEALAGSFGDESIQRHTRKQLRDLADELSDEE